MKLTILISRAALLIPIILTAGCSSPGVNGSSSGGFQLLDRLESDMEIDAVIQVLGEPTSYTEISRAGDREVYHELTYVNTIVDPGVVELFFQPGLVEIRLDTNLYRSFEQ